MFFQRIMIMHFAVLAAVVMTCPALRADPLITWTGTRAGNDLDLGAPGTGIPFRDEERPRLENGKSGYTGANVWTAGTFNGQASGFDIFQLNHGFSGHGFEAEDVLQLRLADAAPGAESELVLLWKRADFLGGFDKSDVKVTGFSAIAKAAGNVAKSSARFVVSNGKETLISEPVGENFGKTATTITLEEPAAKTWFQFDPANPGRIGDEVQAPDSVFQNPAFAGVWLQEIQGDGTPNLSILVGSFTLEGNAP